MEVKIRDAIIDDYQQINDLTVELYQIHHKNRPDIFHDTKICFSKESFQKDLTNHNIKIIVLEKNNRILGYAFLEYVVQNNGLICKKRDIIKIIELVVKKEYRNQGIGKKLHKKIIAFSKEKKCSILELDVWLFNQEAIHFYEKLGYSNKNMKMELKI